MNKFLVTTICLIAVYLFSFKVIPGLFPGIQKLSDYHNIPVATIKNNDFPKRIDALSSVLENNNKLGVTYIKQVDINKIQQTSEVKVNPNASILQDSVMQSQYNSDSLEEFSMKDMVLTEVKEDIATKTPIFMFSLNGNSYISNKGIIGKSSVNVESIDVKAGTVVVKQGTETKTLTIDKSALTQTSTTNKK